MNKTLLAAATALSMISVPAMADHHESGEMTADQQMMYDELSPADRAEFDTYTADQQTMYFGWNDALRGYYWSLNDEQQDAWWYLNDEQRATIFQIQAPEQRAAAWNSVIAQVSELEDGNATTQQAAATTSTTDMRFVSNAVVQDAPAPHQGEYPVCESDADDNCINAWAAGQRGPGVDRPLDYWPGEPASS